MEIKEKILRFDLSNLGLVGARMEIKEKSLRLDLSNLGVVGARMEIKEKIFGNKGRKMEEFRSVFL